MRIIRQINGQMVINTNKVLHPTAHVQTRILIKLKLRNECPGKARDIDARARFLLDYNTLLQNTRSEYYLTNAWLPRQCS